MPFTIQDAVAGIRSLIGRNVYFSINIELDFHPNRETQIEYTIYIATSAKHGPAHFSAKSLEVAYGRAVDAFKSDSEKNNIAAADAALAPLLSEIDAASDKAVGAVQSEA
jgi:hypothetical protein